MFPVMSPPSPWSRTALGVGLAACLLLAACGDSSVGPGGDGDLVDNASAEPATTAAPQVDGGNTVDETTTDEGDTDTADETPAATAPSATGSAWTDVEFQLETVANLAQPIGMTYRPGEDDLWIIERAGRVRLVERTIDLAAGTETLDLLGDPIIDLSRQITTDGEGGLLGMAFGPDGEHLYLHYTDREGDNVISEFPLPADTNVAGEERILLTVPEPYSNHNGGDLAFGPDDMLYISLGDGGSSEDPENNGQDPTTLLGSILRIDPTPSADAPYTIPADNPFASATGGERAEIWNWGLRNPWRMSFDADTGDFWIADVGQYAIEEINRLDAGDPAVPGANLGWRLREGTQEFAGDVPADHIGPVYEYNHEDGRCSVTGGYVYRGPTLPALDGVYLYADFCAPGVAGVQVDTDGTVTALSELSLDRQPVNVISFGQGPGGEVYVMEVDGAVSRIQTPDWPWTTERL